VVKIEFYFLFLQILNHDMPTGFKNSVEITSIAYDAHLLSRSELISFYSHIKRARARQAIPLIRTNEEFPLVAEFH
jgi:hypothetical protein